MRPLVPFVAVVLLVVAVPASVIGLGTAGATAANVAITDVSVSPSSPVPGETVTFTATVENFEGSNRTFVVEGATLRTKPGEDFNEFARIQAPGRVAPGASLRLPLVRSFATPGTRELRIEVYGRIVGGQCLRLTYPVTVRVAEADPRVAVDLSRPIAGVESNATVTVANGLDRDLRNVEVTLSGDVTVERPRQVRSTLGAGETGSFAFEAVPTEAGETGLTATVEYTLANGPTRRVADTKTVRTAELDDRVVLTANASGRQVSVTATNLGNVDAEGLVVRGVATNATVGRAVVGTLRPDERATVRLPVEDVEGAATVEVRADYRVADTDVSVVGDRVRIRSRPGRVELTGIDVQPESGHLVVTGSASNVGLSSVESVVVRVAAADGVTPAPPNREYFVGSIPASDFVSFDVTARVTGDATSIPLEVTYLSDGQRRVERVSVPVRESAVETPNRPDGSGPGDVLLPVAVGVVVVVIVGLLVFVGWRNRRVGD